MKCSECKKNFAIKIAKNPDYYLGRTVIQYTPQGKRKKIFNSITDAAEKTGINRSSINRCCLGERNTAGGYVWEYADIAEEKLYKIISDYIDDCFSSNKTDENENIDNFLKENKNFPKERVIKIYKEIASNFK